VQSFAKREHGGTSETEFACINYIETYHVNNLLQGESKLNFQRLGFISHRPLQGIVGGQEIIEQFSFVGSLQRFCNTPERHTSLKSRLCFYLLGFAAECRSFLRLQLSSGLNLFEPLYCSCQLAISCVSAKADERTAGCTTPCVKVLNSCVQN
jgi:hypothetical protein